MSVTTGQLTAGALVMLPVALIVRPAVEQAFPPLGAIGAILVLAVVCSAFGYVLYFRLIDSAGATNALLVTLLVPPVAILLGALFLGEAIGAARLRRPRLHRARPRGDRRAAAQPFSARRRLPQQLSRFRARPVEIADVAPHLAAVGVVQDRRRQDLRPERSRQRHLRIVIERRESSILSLARKASTEPCGAMSWLTAITARRRPRHGLRERA